MSTAIQPFSMLQIGVETTPGTLVAATRQLVGKGHYKEEQDVYHPTYPRNKRATVGGAGTIIRKGSMLDFESDLSFEQINWFLSTGLKGITPPTVGVDGEYIWIYSPDLAAVPSLKAATVEVIRGDGTTNHYYREFGYAITQKLGLEWKANEIAKLKATMFGRAPQSGTATGSLSAATGLEEMPSNLLKVYIDDTWAGLGGTQLQCSVRSANVELDFGNKPDYTLDGRADLDNCQPQYGKIGATAALVLEFDSVGAAAAFTKARSNSLRYLRLIQLGSLIGGTTYKALKVDMACRFVSMPDDPDAQADGDTLLVGLALEAVYDTTSGKIYEVTTTNALVAL